MPVLKAEFGTPSDQIRDTQNNALRIFFINLTPLIGAAIDAGIENEIIPVNDRPKYRQVYNFAVCSDQNLVSVAAILAKLYSIKIFKDNRQLEDIPASEMVEIAVGLVPKAYDAMILFNGLTPV